MDKLLNYDSQRLCVGSFTSNSFLHSIKQSSILGGDTLVSRLVCLTKYYDAHGLRIPVFRQKLTGLQVQDKKLNEAEYFEVAYNSAAAPVK